MIASALSLLMHPRAMAAAFALLVLTLLGLQSSRLSHANSDLQATRAALRDPATGQTWRSEALASSASLASCRSNLGVLDAALRRQNAAVADLRSEADRNRHHVFRAVQTAKHVGESERRAASEALSKAPGRDACRSADQLILDSLQSGASQ